MVTALAIESYKTIFRLDYKPRLDFYDKLFSVAAALKGYSDWRTDRASVTLQNYDLHCSFSLTFNACWYARDLEAGDERENHARIQAIIDTVVPMMGTEEYIRFGFRRVYLSSVQMAFEDLVSLLNNKLFAQNEKISQGICPQPTDLAYVVDFTDDELDVKLRLGSVRKAELEMHLQPERNLHLGPKERAYPPEILFADYPEVSLLVDIDVSQKTPQSSKLAAIFDAAEDLQSRLSRNVLNYVFGLA